MKLKIDRDYRNSTVLAPFLTWDGDMPRPAFLAVDLEEGEAFIATLPEGCGEPPEGLKLFPVDPCLTVKGIDDLFDDQGVLEALQGVLRGDRDSEAFLWELASSDAYQRLEGLNPMEPHDYFDGEIPKLREGETTEAAAERLCAEALDDLVFLRPLDVEFYLEGDE